MEIQILSQDPNDQGSGEPALVIMHDGVELRWNIPAKELQSDYDIFEQINAYWAQCRLETQADIFNIYSQIYTVFQESWNIDKRVATLRPLIADLMEYHPQEDIYIWAWTKGNIFVPNGIHRTFDPTIGMAGTPERTYLENDYRWLVTLSISLRVMFPIWRQFTMDVRTEVGNIFKEYQAFQLLVLSNAMQSDAMKRFMMFVRHTIPKDTHNDSAVILGISSEDIPDWVLGITVVKRMCCGDVRGINNETTLVAYLYNFIRQKLDYMFRQVGNVTPKHANGYGTDGDSNLSRLEGFKIKQPIADGDISMVRNYIEFQMGKAMAGDVSSKLCLVRRLSPNNDKFHELVQKFAKSSSVLMNARLTREQVTIAAWTMSPYVSPRSIANLQKVDLINLIAFSQAYLWENHHYDLAALVGSVARDNNQEENVVIADRKDAIEKDEHMQLISRFIYHRRTNSRAKNAKSVQPVINTIDALTDRFSQRQRHLTMPDDMVAKINGNARNRYYTTPVDIRTLLSRLIIDVDDRMKTEVRVADYRSIAEVYTDLSVLAQDISAFANV